MTLPAPRRRALACIAVWTAIVAGADAAGAATTLTVDQYRASLDGIAAAVDTSQAPQALPDEWRVRLDGVEYRVPLRPLARDLQAWRARHDPQVRSRILQRVDALRAEVVAATRPPVDRAAEHARLTTILSAPEFRRVSGPTWRDRLKQTIVEWLVWLFSIPLTSSTIPTLGRLAIFGLVALAVVLLAWTVYRYIERTDGVVVMPSVQGIVPAREWQQWLVDARAAADRGDWRDAVHFTYWCAIAYLEARGSWRPDRTRTPREYVRLLPMAGSDRATLAELTAGFERVWYGTVDADAQSYDRAMTQLQTIGCPLA